MTKQPRFSIVVPTHNRAAELYHTLRTCLDQDFDANCYEIVVSDNCSTDNVRQVVESLGTDRIRYEKTERFLSMTESWNFALSLARGQYVGFVGTDDGFLLHMLPTVDEMLRSSGIDVVTFQGVQYHWPNSPFKDQRNNLTIPKYSFAEGVLPSEELISQALCTIDYGRLPNFLNSFCSRTVIDRIIAKDNRFFKSYTPDVYSSFRIGAEVDELCVSNQTLLVSACSAKSNGANLAVTPDSSIARQHVDMHCDEGLRTELLPDPTNVPTMIANGMLAALADAGQGNAFARLNLEAYVLLCSQDAMNRSDGKLSKLVDEYIAGLAAPLRRRIRRMVKIQRVENGDSSGVISYAARKLRKLLQQRQRHLTRTISRTRRFGFDDHGCENVYDAAVFAGAVLRRQARSAA